MRILLAPALFLLLGACGPAPRPAPPSKPAELPKPADESRRFPHDNLLETKVVDSALLGKPFMPGGTLARYKKGNREFVMFAGKLPSPTGAALLLLDWKKSLVGAKLVPPSEATSAWMTSVRSSSSPKATGSRESPACPKKRLTSRPALSPPVSIDAPHKWWNDSGFSSSIRTVCFSSDRLTRSFDPSPTASASASTIPPNNIPNARSTIRPPIPK